MSRFSAARKIFSLFLVFALFTLRLGSFSEERFITPVEDALFDRMFIAEDSPLEGKPKKANTKQVMDVLLDAPQTACVFVEKIAQTAIPFVNHFIPRITASEIFIPPESLA